MQSSDGSKPQVCVWSGHPELHRFILSLTAQSGLSREVSGLITSGLHGGVSWILMQT